ncbi:MAG TPA: DUF6516 family protein [Burkholderiales bacterium]
MANFFDKLPFETAAGMEQLSRLMYELRDHRAQLLAQYEAADEAALLERIGDGRVAEHPAYEHYLGTCILTTSRDAVRTELQAMLNIRRAEQVLPHLDLKEKIDAHYADRLDAPVQLAQDALTLRLANGVAVELRFASEQEYAMAWQWGDAQLKIDTAPLHPDLATFPNHLHDANNSLRADPITQPGRDAWENVRNVIDALLADPLLQRE